MNPKLLRLVLCTCLVTFLMACQKDSLYVESVAQAEAQMPLKLLVSLNDQTPSTVVPEPENSRELQKLYKRYDRLQLKSVKSLQHTANLPFEATTDGVYMREILKHNLEVLRSQPIDFICTEKNGLEQVVSPEDTKPWRLSSDKKVRQSFYIVKPSALTGLSNVIEVGSPNSKSLIAVAHYTKGPDTVSMFPAVHENGSLWTKGWKFQPRGDGFFSIISDNIRDVQESPDPGLGYTFTNYGWEYNPKTHFIDLSMERPDNKNQLFKLRPQGKYSIVAVRYATSENRFFELMHLKDPYKEMPKEVFAPHILKDGDNLMPVLKRLGSFYVERKYTNETNAEQDYDMKFDDEVDVDSYFTPLKTLDFDIQNLGQTTVLVPTIINGELNVSPKSTPEAHSFPYKEGYQTRKKKLSGVLHLRVPARTVTTISYQYTKYAIYCRYIAYLKDLSDGKIVTVIGGYWSGVIYAEDMKNKHKFSTDGIDDGDDDIVFEATVEEAVLRGLSPIPDESGVDYSMDGFASDFFKRIINLGRVSPYQQHK